MAVAMRTKLIVFITVVALGIVGAFGWVGYQLFTTGAPDLRLSDIQSMSDGEIFWVIHNGIRFTAMPA